eukprot:GSChrysophyteH1.ASY1.ANO1.2280.1 assembled CDS
METNVKVAVRCRPLSGKEVERGCGSIIKSTDKTVHIDQARDFTFDHCYDEKSTQEQVYKDLGSPVVDQALDGFNCTIFAYGQTGSGKSHSMMGYGEDAGIIPRLNEDLWARLHTLLGEQIYNEEIKDLINPSKKVMKIRENKERGIYVEDLCELIVKDAHSVMKLIEQGNTVRRVASTNMNDTSSRSHSVFTAKLNLVDLAGSERAEKTGATGSILKEGANINMSLMALGNVINALSEAGSSGHTKHIPYRDSKLTRLLQESLGGNAATVMIAAISPADYNYDETLSTLKYANRAKTIANAVTKNEDVNQRMINDLKKEIEALRAKVAKKLAHELEAERQANMNVVMSDMLEGVKEKKVQQMKNIKHLKSQVDKDMKIYAEIQAKYDTELNAGREALPENVKMSNEMAKLLAGIEDHRTEWMTMKENMKKMKERLSKIDEEVTTERAELVATAEEKSERILQLEKELEATKYEAQQYKLTIAQKDQKISDLEKYSNSLEEKLTDSEVLLESTKADLEDMKNATKAVKSDSTDLQSKIDLLESQKYNLFEALMNQFQEDRKGLLRGHQVTKDFLTSATRDLMHMVEENKKLKADLQDAITWEK